MNNYIFNKRKKMEYINIEQLPKTSNYDTLLGLKDDSLVLVNRIKASNLEADITNLNIRVGNIESELDGLNNLLKTI